MKIGKVDTKKQVALVAEIGNNHEGSVNLAKDLISSAVQAGADAVKLQIMIPNKFVSKLEVDRLKNLNKFSLTESGIAELFNYANKNGVYLFASPFDDSSAELLSNLTSTFKIASGDITHHSFIELISNFGKDIILSTGASDFKEIDDAVSIINLTWKKLQINPNLALLHCISEYPADPSTTNLRVINVLKQTYPNLTIGYSDHTIGIENSILAVAAGANIIEKHFTLDKHYSEFRDHALSADYDEFKELRNRIDTLEIQLGSGLKYPTIAEERTKNSFRRSVYAAKSLKKGQIIKFEDMICLRPALGISANKVKSLIGLKLLKDVSEGDLLNIENLGELL
jgi:sialic acid synthase SpsE